MFTIISYDIVNDRRRTKVAKCLLGYGLRVQYSVFECYLEGAVFSKLQVELRELIDINTDSVRCYRLDDAARERTQIVGIGRVTIDPLYVWV
jgi:CRISPR-associated protein Cas2